MRGPFPLSKVSPRFPCGFLGLPRPVRAVLCPRRALPGRAPRVSERLSARLPVWVLPPRVACASAFRLRTCRATVRRRRPCPARCGAAPGGAEAAGEEPVGEGAVWEVPNRFGVPLAKGEGATGAAKGRCSRLFEVFSVRLLPPRKNPRKLRRFSASPLSPRGRPRRAGGMGGRRELIHSSLSTAAILTHRARRAPHVRKCAAGAIRDKALRSWRRALRESTQLATCAKKICTGTGGELQCVVSFRIRLLGVPGRANPGRKRGGLWRQAR